MKIYIIEDIHQGATGAFLHEEAALDALDMDEHNFYNPSKYPPRIMELEVEGRARLFPYRPASYTGEIKTK